MRVGIFWYRSADDYNHLLTVFSDAKKLPGTYEDWLLESEESERCLRRNGDTPVRVYAEPWNFVPWCYAHDSYVNAEGRDAFVDWFLARESPGD